MLAKRLRAIHDGFLFGLAVVGILPYPEGEGVHVLSVVSPSGERLGFYSWMKHLQENQTEAIKLMFLLIVETFSEMTTALIDGFGGMRESFERVLLGQDILVSLINHNKEEVLTDMATLKSTLDGIVSEIAGMRTDITAIGVTATNAASSAAEAESAAGEARDKAEAARVEALASKLEAEKIDSNVGDYAN